jgi:UDP-sulfoquinovose synthase
VTDTGPVHRNRHYEPTQGGRTSGDFQPNCRNLSSSGYCQLVAKMTGVEVNFIPNPRQEAAENELDVSNQKFCEFGIDPITLDEGLFEEVTEVVKKFKNRCNPEKILPASFWNKKRAEECASIDPKSIKIAEVIE